jgi:hypothetical protein
MVPSRYHLVKSTRAETGSPMESRYGSMFVERQKEVQMDQEVEVLLAWLGETPLATSFVIMWKSSLRLPLAQGGAIAMMAVWGSGH